MPIKKVMVIGAGVVGKDLALDLACHGYSVILHDRSQKALDNVLKTVPEALRLVKLLTKSLRSVSIDDILSKLILTTSGDHFHEVDLVIENIPENWEVKKSLYLKIGNLCNSDIIYGVNTSCISITKIAALLPDPKKVIGMHFMTPVPLKQLVEVVRGYHTSDETVDLAENFVRSLNKTPVVVNDLPGFVTNRVIMLTINESIWTVHDQVAGPQDVDTIFRLGFGHPMGPLATADLIGLDSVLNSLLVLYESYNDDKYKPCPLLRKLVDAGLLGRKTGKGFFVYES